MQGLHSWCPLSGRTRPIGRDGCSGGARVRVATFENQEQPSAPVSGRAERGRQELEDTGKGAPGEKSGLRAAERVASRASVCPVADESGSRVRSGAPPPPQRTAVHEDTQRVRPSVSRIRAFPSTTGFASPGRRRRELGTWNCTSRPDARRGRRGTYELSGTAPASSRRARAVPAARAFRRPGLGRGLGFSRALLEGGLTAHDSGIHRVDGTVRWVAPGTRRCWDDQGGRSSANGRRVADITEEKLRATAANPARRRLERILLGAAGAAHRRVGEATGSASRPPERFQFLRSSRKNSRRFAPEDVLDYLRRGTATWMASIPRGGRRT